MEMLGLTLSRFTSIVLTALAIIVLQRQFGSLSQDAYMCVLLALALAHYAASFIYARRQIGAVAATRGKWLSLAALGAITVVLYYFPDDPVFALLCYFGIHHVFNETYLSHRALGSRFEQLKRLRIAGFALNGALYVAILSREPAISRYLDVQLIAAIAAAAALFFVLEWRRAARHMDWAQRVNSISLELMAGTLAIGVMSFGLRVQFLDVVLYHVVFWAIHPPVKMAIAGAGPALRRYGAINAALLLAAFAVSPWGLWSYPLKDSLYLEAFYFLSFLHIGASFAISDQHPQWLIRLFRPAATTAVQAP